MFIQYTTKEGPVLGSAQRVERVLTIQGAPLVATYTTVRPPIDQAGAPIGTFVVSVPKDQEHALFRAAHAAQWRSPVAATGGGPGRSYMTLSYKDTTLNESLGFSQMDVDVMQRVEELLDEVRGVVGLALANPKRALIATVEKVGAVKPGGGVAFALGLKNIGTEAVCVFDPRRLNAAPSDAWAAVQVAVQEPEVPGFTSPPLQWTSIQLLAHPETSKPPPPLTIAVGQELKFTTVDWVPAPNTRYVAQAVVHDYEAPSELDGVPCVRGAVFSAHLSF